MKHPSSSEPDPFAALKQGVRWMWSLGDYSALARILEPYAADVADSLELDAETSVLDVAAGNGNFALAAASRGAHVVACDLTPAMVELGRARTQHAGLDVEWLEADAEDLPFPPGGFDVVGSVFGAMFAPRQSVVAAELFRVVRPGGVVAMANYTSDGFLGAMSDLMARFSRPAPAALPSPFAWGDEQVVRELFGARAATLEMRRGTITFRFDSPEDGLAFWERTNPPLAALRSTVPAETYTRLRQATGELMRTLDRGRGDGLVLESGYLTVLATSGLRDVDAELRP